MTSDSAPRATRSASGVLEGYGRSILLFLFGAVSYALPLILLNALSSQPGLNPAFAYVTVVALAIFIAPVLGAIAWGIERRGRGLIALLLGVMVGGIVGFLPTGLHGPPGFFYGDPASLILIVDGWAVLWFAFGWGMRGFIARSSGPALVPKGIERICGRCGKRVSPYWREQCGHCGALFSEFPPTERIATPQRI